MQRSESELNNTAWMTYSVKEDSAGLDCLEFGLLLLNNDSSNNPDTADGGVWNKQVGAAP